MTKIVEYDRQVDFETGKGILWLKLENKNGESCWLKMNILNQIWYLNEENAIKNGLREIRGES